MNIDDIDYYLPPELIAQKPADRRDQSRLMVLERDAQRISHKKFFDLVDLLDKNDVLVLNNTKVIKARLFGKRLSGGHVECFLLEPMTETDYKVLLKPAKRLQVGETVKISDDFAFRILEKDPAAESCVVRFVSEKAISKQIEKCGNVPLPPYIKPENPNEFLENYQTIYAKHPGAVAAPTAGLHFTKDLIQKLETRGVQIKYITLHVGLGTFLPIKNLDINNHKMHKEFYSVDEATAEFLTKAFQAKKRIIAVGTTVARTLETVFKENYYEAGAKYTKIFIKPGYKIKAFQGLITNFHLPKSTLLLLTMAFAGKELMLEAYQKAIAEKYRFYSFGDAMLIYL